VTGKRRIRGIADEVLSVSMLTVWIDNERIEVEPGSTVLDAARRLGIDIPALCHWPGRAPVTSCMACLVRVEDDERLVPSCSLPVRDGMHIQSEVAEVHDARRTAIELLLSDHAGDCLAPCHRICPLHMNIPKMARQISEGDLRSAIQTVREDIALPSILGRVCHHPCEGGCRRGPHDGAVTVQQMERYVADEDFAAEPLYTPTRQPDTGKRVAVVGTGVAGLTAGYHLLRMGHSCGLYDKDGDIGGSLRSRYSQAELPCEVVDAEVDLMRRLGAAFFSGARLGQNLSLGELRADFDAVLLATGQGSAALAKELGIASDERGIVVAPRTCATEVEGVFAAGEAVRGECLLVRAAADGKLAAAVINRLFRGEALAGAGKEFSSAMGRVAETELSRIIEGQSQAARVEWGTNQSFISGVDLRTQATRCLHCDCRKADTCRLRHYAQEYQANPRKYRTQRRDFSQQDDHPFVLYEPGKCISCGRCVSLCSEAGGSLGLTHIGRGFDVRIGVPFAEPLQGALEETAEECVAACPTGALSRKQEGTSSCRKSILCRCNAAGAD